MSIVLTSRSGSDGKLHLEIPVDAPNAEFEVEVVIRPRVGKIALPPGYFDLIGSIDDETFVRPPQGESRLVTHNVAEFSRVPGLIVEDWQIP